VRHEIEDLRLLKVTDTFAEGGGIRQSAGTLSVTDVTFAHNGYAPNGSQVNTGGGALSWGDGPEPYTIVGEFELTLIAGKNLIITSEIYLPVIKR
jgi:hypothetical protein